ncbi:hypothetical protein MKY34_11195 [Sporosarcina sp. FSL K6-1522]|uniref:hypothetical protein n=1 Tax=Sporosarcina sp. FSL K6-1522 TaxID=2921554 RepID=UPI00315B21A4
MARLKFEMFVDEWSSKNRGVSSTFTDGNGVESTSWWSSPPDSISHVDIGYLKGRYGNVKTKRHEVFIKSRFREEMQRLVENKEIHI